MLPAVKLAGASSSVCCTVACCTVPLFSSSVCCTVAWQRMGDSSPPRAGRAVSAARRGRSNRLAAHWQSSPAASPATSCPSCHHLSLASKLGWAAQALGQVWTQLATVSDQTTAGGKIPPRDSGGDRFAGYWEVER